MSAPDAIGATRESELDYAEATTLAAAIRSRRVSPVELVEHVLRRADALQPKLHAFITLDHEGARAAARAAEDAIVRGDAQLGPLHGLPVSVKDLEPTAGLRTTYGSKFFENTVPNFDGAVAGRLRSAGAIIFAKSNTPHFGYKDMSDNLVAPATRNPWKLDRTSGGSSGGAASSVAAGIGPLAHGSDGAGSIRIPAALCGVFGFKGSLGLVPYWPNADFWAARSHNGPIARTVRDAALMLNVIAGPDPRDPISLDLPARDWVAECVGVDLQGLRVAWSPDFGYANVDPEVARVCAAAVRRFEELGCHVEEVTPGWEDPAEWASMLWDFTVAARNMERADQRPEWFETTLLQMVDRGRNASAAELGRAQLARTAFYEQARTFMERFDLLVTPQMPLVAWGVDEWPSQAMFDRLPFTYPFNLTGWPAACLPCGFNSEGLPIALQVVTGWHQDALCLRAAAAFEAAQPWAQHRPPLAA